MHVFGSRLSARSWVQVYESLVVLGLVAMAVPTTKSIIVGFFTSFFGVFFRVWARGYVGREKTGSIVGPYRFVRHPHYLGTFLYLFGMCLASRNSLVTFIMLIGCVFLFKVIKEEEEAIGRSSSGRRYKDYKLRIPSFVPCIIGYRDLGGKTSHFSLAHAMLRSQKWELNAFVALLFVYVFMFLLMRLHEPRLIQLVVASVLGTVGFFTFVFMRRRGRV